MGDSKMGKAPRVRIHCVYRSSKDPWSAYHRVSPSVTQLTCRYSQLQKCLGISFNNSRELNKIIDHTLQSRRPRFERHEVIIKNEACDVYFRDIKQCIQALWADRELTNHLIFKPERHYEDPDHTERMYDDMHTAKWWWDTQVCQYSPPSTPEVG